MGFEQIKDWIPLLNFIIPFMLIWLYKVWTRLDKLDKELAINTVKDDEIWNKIDDMAHKLDELISTVGKLAIDLEYQKGKNSK